MAVSRLKLRQVESTFYRRNWTKRFPGLMGFIMLLGTIATFWFIHETSMLPVGFQNLKQMASWVQVPMVAWEVLLAPTVILLLIAFIVMRLSPLPRPWSRAIVVSILLALTLRYLVWRSASTLNLSTPLNQFFSIGLFGLELLIISSSIIQLILMLRVRDRRREANLYSISVVEGSYNPSVDILIPTYNEPAFILRRTIIGCQAIDYNNKQIYLLDDTRRPEIKALAAELGCHYLTRPDNQDAKAGNLNYAIAHTSSELIAVFDADFVPTSNFLTRTVGFFQNKKIALVQTPQSFYSPDPIAHNLGLVNVLTPDEEVFYRQIQPIKDGVGSAVCAGTSFVVRRSTLEENGCFVTGTLCEDYFTGIQLSASGHELVYLDEKLSAGLAAETMSAYAAQRLRWARGTMQSFFVNTNPLTIPGLTPLQRLAHLDGLMIWFASLSRVGYLLMPLAYAFLKVIPVIASPQELVYFFLPYCLVSLSVFSWLNYRSRSAILSDVYSLLLAVPISLTVIQTIARPFSKGFQVTPKGSVRDRYSFNWRLATPLLILLILTAISFWLNWNQSVANGGWAAVEMSAAGKGLNLGWIWSVYNLLMISIVLLILLDVPKLDSFEWLNLRCPAEIKLQQPEGKYGIASAQYFMGVTTVISEGGAEIALTHPASLTVLPGQKLPVTIELLENRLNLQGMVTQVETKPAGSTIRVQFDPLSLVQHRQLVEFLFCCPGRWKRQTSPGELQSLVLLFKILLKPKVLFGRHRSIQAIAVAKS